MSDEDDSSEKPFDPSQKKLDDARKKGDIVKSVDLMTAAGYGGILVAAYAFGAESMVKLGSTLTAPLAHVTEMSERMFNGGPQVLVGTLAKETVIGAAPWFAIPMALVVLTILAQQAFVVAPDKIIPKMSRISPKTAIKNKFGRTGLFEFFKSFSKLCIYMTIVSFYLKAQLPRLVSTMQLSPAQVSIEMAKMTLSLMQIVFFVALTLGVIDYMFQKAEHTRKLSMSRKEMTDEAKQAEGDPQLKAQRRQKAIMLAMNQMLAEVPNADVVLVNPTHYAVALSWDRTSGRAPICCAKGADDIAAKIREIAAENGIPIRSDPPAARALYATVGIGEEIGREHYRAAAAAIRFSESIRKRAAKVRNP
ncbi:MAG: flagellar biosynthesis protein FlhB [Rhodobacteraceae bacterium]|nr:flagellar biosynthesis protein FlhB [Paracoccaceae bacterium]